LAQGRVLAAEQSLMAKDRSHFAVLTPQDVNHTAARRLELFVYDRAGIKRDGADVLYLTAPNRNHSRTVWLREALPKGPVTFLGTNGRGGMSHTAIRWAQLYSRYDALLAGNLNPDYPEDRWIMLTRLRGWVVFQGYSQEIQHACLERFSFDYDSRGVWTFRIPAGQGESVRVSACLQMVPGQNRITLSFLRHGAAELRAGLADHRRVTLILRPDVEDRSFHDTTKAFTGPEHRFPAATAPQPDGFVFGSNPGRRLFARLSSGRFVYQPEWHYMVHRPLEAERGLDPDSDLFSPGYFECVLAGGETVTLDAAIAAEAPPGLAAPFDPSLRPARRLPPDQALRAAMEQYIVRRQNLATVIAGYPWFLDWGRDTLIFVRGLVAAGQVDLSRAIVLQFAQFEAHGTLPNMIRGADARNRDTSDAPLWLFVACRDLLAAGQRQILESACGARTLRHVLVDMGQHLCQGTPNGIRMDPASGLLFSPSHFTWMDTNHPAGTPREGYPVEIQALWHAGLRLLADIDRGAARGRWRALADRVRKSAAKHFFLEDLGYMADCLHGPPGCPAADAEADDALRPNQLFALTLGLVREPAFSHRMLRACETLLVPGGIRSLADREVRRPLTIVHRGQTIGDPHHPYRGRYAGDEDSSRKPAYHNGTAWTWVFPSFCEAWHLVYGPSGRPTAAAWLGSVIDRMNTGCLGHLPEIMEGDAPHDPRGCDAQAWSASEAFRVWRLLNDPAD
jgi:glycogen debranching enzyme